MGICRENLPWLFAAGIFRGYLPREFVSKTFWFVRFSLLTVFLFIIAVAVMGHRPKVIVDITYLAFPATVGKFYNLQIDFQNCNCCRIGEEQPDVNRAETLVELH